MKDAAQMLTFSTSGPALKAELPINSTIPSQVSNVPALQNTWRDLSSNAELGTMDQQIHPFQRDAAAQGDLHWPNRELELCVSQ